MPRPPKLSNEEFIELWKRTKGNLSEMQRILKNVTYRTLQNYKEKLEKEGKLTLKEELKKQVSLEEEFSDFSQIPEVKEFIDFRFERMKSKKTIKREIGALRLLWKFTKKRPLAITPNDLWAYIGERRKEGKIGGLFGFVVSIRAFWDFARKKGYIDGDTYQKYIDETSPKSLKLKPKLVYLEKEEVEKLIEALKKLSKSELEALMWEAFVRVKVTTGARTGDPEEGKGMVGLKMSNIHIEGNQVYIDFYEKGNEIWQNCKPSPRACEALIKFLQAREKAGIKSDYVFSLNGKPLLASYVQDAFREARKLAGITKPCHPHILRKTYLTWLILAGVPLEVAVDLNVGWKNIQTAKDHYLSILQRSKEVELHKFAKFIGEAQ